MRNAIAENKSVIEDCAHQFQKSAAEIQKVINAIRVSGGESQVSEKGDDLAKLKAVYESEILARGGSSGIESVQRMQYIQMFEQGFAKEFEGIRFQSGKYSYPAVILDASGKHRPHPLLIDIIRKPGGKELIEPERL